MKFQDTGLDGLLVEFQLLEEIMESAGFAYQYDYERATFDYKIIDQVHNDVYYFRIPSHVEEGEIPSPHCMVRIMTPYVGKHYYPHGVEYDENFPQFVTDKCHKKIQGILDKVKTEAL